MKKFFKYFFISFAISYIIFLLFFQFTYDKSLPYSFWVKNYNLEKTYKYGDYVKFKLDKPDNFIGERIMVKEIKCRAGQTLTKYKDEFFCNGQKLGKALKKAKDGRDLPVWNIKEVVIPEGQFYVSGEHERSYDSRYYGLIKETQVTGKLYPVRKIIEGVF